MVKKNKSKDDARRHHNADLIRRMRNGEPLNAVDSKTSWYPPRPLIQKDAREMARLYPQTAGQIASTATATVEISGNLKPLTLKRSVAIKPPLGEAS